MLLGLRRRLHQAERRLRRGLPVSPRCRENGVRVLRHSAKPHLRQGSGGRETGAEEPHRPNPGRGRGGVMECCKAVSMAATYRGPLGGLLVPASRTLTPSLWASLRRSPGTGSACNGGAVITNKELKIKTGRDYARCNARFALMDPSYTFSVPAFQMVSGDIAETLMRGVIRDLRAAIAGREDCTARSNLMWGPPWRKTESSSWANRRIFSAA